MLTYQLYDKNQKLVLADVIKFDDDQVIVKWRGHVKSLTIHKSLDEFCTISLNDSRQLIETKN